MNLLFFQNIVSPHQMPYIQHLPKMEGVEDVVVIVPEVNLGERDALGWDARRWLETEGVRFVVSPSDKEVEDLFYDNLNPNPNLNGNGTWCLFSGINAFPEVATWFRASLKYNVKRAIITEPPYVYEHPLWQHAIRFALRDWRYVKYIDKVFVMGEDYMKYYRFWSKRWEVIPFMYCTEENNVNETLRYETLRYETLRYETLRYENENENENQNKNCQLSIVNCQLIKGLRVVYVGSLSHRKNVQCLLKATALLSEEEQEQLEIGIVGDGDEREKLEHLAAGLTTSVKFYGTQPMERIPEIMEQYDVLVLPSLHDGWGAVVNEALTLGLYVICSDHCGAKMLLKSADNGMVFKSDNDKDFALKMRICVQEREIIREGAKRRIDWSREHIDGKAVASYFLSRLQ